MQRIRFILLLASCWLLSCEKENEHPYTYWSDLINEKYGEITSLTQSVNCTDIDQFDIIHKNGYHLVHPSIKTEFDVLMNELDRLQTEAGKAASREGIMNDMLSVMAPNPPLRKECRDGKPKLVYAQELTLEEVEAEIPNRYEEIRNFYNDVPCTDANNWTGHFLRVACCYEGVAVHKTIRSAELFDRIHIFNRLQEVKLHLEKKPCMGTDCARFAKPVQCVEGKAVVELTQN